LRTEGAEMVQLAASRTWASDRLLKAKPPENLR